MWNRSLSSLSFFSLFFCFQHLLHFFFGIGSFCFEEFLISSPHNGSEQRARKKVVLVCSTLPSSCGFFALKPRARRSSLLSLESFYHAAKWLQGLLGMYWAEGEISSFIKVWLSAYIYLFYCYFSGKILTGGVSRLACFLPVVCLFLLLPLQLHSMHLGGVTAFFLAWLTNFKLLMFAFNRGPLANPSISFPRFLAVACLPIKLIQHNPHKKTKENETSITPKYAHRHRSIKNYAMKGLLLALIVKIYSFEEYIHPRIILVIYCFHIYFALEIMLAIAAAMARGLLGAELEPQFNEPYLSTSLQDFWGRRWNLMVTRILRPTLYIPVLHWSTGLMGRDWAPLPAVMSTFVVSGLIHELIFFYLGRVKPTWEITWFFLLHGVCLNVEIAIKKVVNGRWQLPMAVSTILTVGFVMVTGFSLFFPPLLRCGGVERGLAELFAVGTFAKDVARVVGLAVN